jgi:galacturan 1,4-alpha-galacturonidase
MGLVDVKGPCKAAIEIQVDGIIQAPGDPSALKGAEQWVRFSYVSSLTLSGKGTFDGVGATAWKQNDCSKNSDCKMLPMVNTTNLNII